MAFSTEEIQDRLRRTAELLLRIAERPDAVEELAAAAEARDAERFAAVPGRLGLEVPGDICDPYVTGFIATWQPPTSEEVCYWTRTGRRIRPLRFDDKTRAAFGSAEDSRRMFELLKALGLITCETVLKPGGFSFKEVRVFRQGVCPPGTF